MPDPVKNSAGQKWPAIYYGLHMVPGVAEYSDGPGGQPYRVYISADTAKRMDPTFATCPVYVEHVDDEQPNAKNKTIEGATKDQQGNPEKKIADGYVIESFYNPPDGNHWAKFIITSEEGVRAIENGDRLSNCYQPTNLGPGGECHGVSYSREFTDAEYKHLAIVKSPRYKESLICTPEEFKVYNDTKVGELAAMRNSADVSVKTKSKAEGSMSLLSKLFARKTNQITKKEPVENADEIGKIEVALGKNRTTTIAALVKNAEEMGDKDFEKLNDLPEREDLEKNDDEDLEDPKKKNRKKSDDADEVDPEKNEDEEDPKGKKNGDKGTPADKDKASNDDADDKAAFEEFKKNRKRNRKKSDDDDTDPEDKKNDDEDPEDKKNDDEDPEDKKNDDSVLKHVMIMDGEEKTVGEMIQDHVDLKNRHNALRKKHDALKEEYSGLQNKYGDDETLNDDADVPADDKAAQEVLGKLEQEEDNLTESLERRKNQITRVIGRMKNSKELKEARIQKEEEGKQHFERLQNAEQEAILNAEMPMVSTSTSMSQVERGKSRYGSKS